jgi:hypothetical protein
MEETYSSHLYELLSTRLEDDELEELLCVYLQRRHGYFVHGSAWSPFRRPYMLRNAEGNTATVQVVDSSTGRSRFERRIHPDGIDRVFVFSRREHSGEQDIPGVAHVHHEDLVELIETEAWTLPLAVAQYLEPPVLTG